MANDLPVVMQSLTSEQISDVARRAGCSESSVVDVIALMNTDDAITLGNLELTPDIVVGWILCEMHYQER